MKRIWRHGPAWVLAGVWVWAGGAKALDPVAFAESVAGFHIVPWPVAVVLAYYLPWLELVVGLGLLVQRWRAESAWVATGLCTVFAILWAVTWWRGINVACGCFGGSGEGSALWGLARAVGMAVWAWGIYFNERKGQGRSWLSVS